MDNVPITGGIDVGAPRNWDVNQSGECLTISVLYHEQDGRPYATTAWKMTDAELAAAESGHVMLSIAGVSRQWGEMPVIRIWSQDAHGTVAGDIVSTTQRDAAMRAAVVAIAIELNQRTGMQVDSNALKALKTADVLEHMMRMAHRVPARGGTVGGKARLIPIQTLDDVLAEARELPGIPALSYLPDPGTDPVLGDVLSGVFGGGIKPGDARPLDSRTFPADDVSRGACPDVDEIDVKARWQAARNHAAHPFNDKDPQFAREIRAGAWDHRDEVQRSYAMYEAAARDTGEA